MSAKKTAAATPKDSKETAGQKVKVASKSDAGKAAHDKGSHAEARAANVEARPARSSVTAAKPADTQPVKGVKAAAGTAAAEAKAAKPAKPAKGNARPEVKPSGKPGKKSEAKAAAPEDDVDLADVEGEFEAEAEAQPEVVDEKAEKAKPLRMKVSRAKERALMREFGLDETALTEEEAVKRRQELKTLIKMGKTRGFLTHQEINDHLPEKLVNEEIL